MKPIIKAAILVALLTAYWFYGGFAPARDRSLMRLCFVVDLFFLSGAALALWGGGAPIGTLHPVSLRGIFIAVGGLAMAGAFVVMVATREDRTGTPHWPFDKQGARVQHPAFFLIQNDYV